jgi:hypothetical protein
MLVLSSILALDSSYLLEFLKHHNEVIRRDMKVFVSKKPASILRKLLEKCLDRGSASEEVDVKLAASVVDI